MSTIRRLCQSSGLLVGIRLFQRSLGLISTLLLARVLMPADFGVVAVAALIIHFSEVLSNTGIQQYIVQAEEANDETINTAWTLDLILKGSVCILLFCSLPGISWFYDDPNIVYAVGALIPVILIRAMTNPELHVQRRNLSYGVIFRIGVISKLISFLMVIAIALITRSFWAIIVGDLVTSIVSVSLSYFYCARRPSLSLRNVSRQWLFSRWMLARGSVGYIRAQVDTLLISQFYSLSQLGKFNVAREFTIMPANEIIQPAVEPLLATFSSVRTDYQKLTQQISLALLVISIFTAPFVAFIYQFYESIVFYLLGENWSEAAPLMQAMTPLLFAFALGGILNNVCFALAKIKIVFWYDVVSLILIFGTLLSAQGIALISFIWLRSFIGLVAVIIFLYICSRLVRASFAAQIILLVVPLVASFATASLAYLMIFQNSFLLLVLSGVFFVLCYGIVMLALACFLSRWSPTWNYIYKYSLKFLHKLGKKF
ncbi:oligosaccharide flippase family protein [Marinobacter sp. 1_MG-2023]|uniref:oligosaccharide flippase family protein n=1 Tax=Marinobacter sp. 1_MG-2023 TaxID=3062627 RepID=UPI0026E2F0F7|nr:oligosaccharide flippase family protein [Marinobacter sp. 1_MG-2023]MDO6824580.1 oligosaccharide flippase family protein [Marinobacter sp. 1_MG-2023]